MLSNPMSSKKFGFRAKSRLFSTEEVLQSLFEKSKGPLSLQFKRWKLWQNWQNVVGASIASQSLPIRIDKGILWVWVPNSAVMQEFNFVNSAIKDRVNDSLGQRIVRQVRFTLERKAVPTQQEAPESIKGFLEKSDSR